MYAVVFTSRLSEDDEGYEEAARRMLELCGQQKGFVSAESARGPDGHGITVCLWESLEAIDAWREHPEHRATQREGEQRWYDRWDTMVCEVLDRL
jgi:heme-degrading monooxygenase HmoA